METALNILSVLPENKAQIQTFKASFLNEFETVKNPIEIARRIKCVVETFKAITDDNLYKEIVIDALDKEGGKCEINGAKIEKMEGGTKYNFSICNDNVWKELDSQIAELSEHKKNRETFLKSLANQVDEVISTDGEILQSPIKTSTTTFKITL